mmetsp:Transcript_12246/g.29119  ORF Transcript_12246/g.29119 Transcript_12246/m.29119 type:complete len:280 (-) Transcript_12246:371-1210(-)
MAANQEQYNDEIPFYDQNPQEERTVADTAELDRDAGANVWFHNDELLFIMTLLRWIASCSQGEPSDLAAWLSDSLDEALEHAKFILTVATTRARKANALAHAELVDRARRALARSCKALQAIFHAQGLLHMLDDPENIAKVNWSPEVHQELDKLRRFAEACPDFARAAGHLHRKLCLECIALSYLLPRQDLLHLAGHWIDLLGHGRVDRFQIDFGEVAYVLEELDKLVDGPNDPADTLYEQLEAWYTELKRVEPDHICPAGLEFRMDMETGRNFARLSS